MQRRYSVPFFLLACALAAAAPAQGRNKYAYTVVPLAAPISGATAINNAGDVAGQLPPIPYSPFPSPHGGDRAFLSSGGVLADLGTLAGDNGTLAWGINNNKQVVGTSYAGYIANYHGFLYSDGVMHDIGSLAGGNTFAYDINDAGDIVGQSVLQQQFGFAFLYRNGVMRNLSCLPGSDRSSASAINNKGQIAGTSGVGPAQGPNGNQTHAVMWEYGVIKDLGTLGGLNSSAEDINARGEVVGSSTIAGGDVLPYPDWHGFIWSDGKMRDIGAPPNGSQVMPLAINVHGDVVGLYNRSGGQSAFLYRHDNKISDLAALVDPAQGWTITIAYDINDAGQIVGQGCHQEWTSCVAVRLDPVQKEPGED